jgi:hypothetical protein
MRACIRYPRPKGSKHPLVWLTFNLSILDAALSPWLATNA